LISISVGIGEFESIISLRHPAGAARSGGSIGINCELVRFDNTFVLVFDESIARPLNNSNYMKYVFVFPCIIVDQRYIFELDRLLYKKIAYYVEDTDE
jgi:hypothetical protein